MDHDQLSTDTWFRKFRILTYQIESWYSDYNPYISKSGLSHCLRRRKKLKEAKLRRSKTTREIFSVFYFKSENVNEK